ncbi:hypothetical protein KC640_01880, partial [Candidatus Dojkabacteria bacterium]|nr:hypothetical protein [Candidatus Dojkabacteria bacterium]
LVLSAGDQNLSSVIKDAVENTTQQLSGSENSSSDKTGWDANCEDIGRVQMQNSPMDLPDVGSIIPLGLVAGAHVTPIDHLYFSPLDFNSPRDAYPVYAMADGYIIDVGVRRQMVDTGAARPPEYRIVFQHSCQTISYFDLVTSLDDSILSQIPRLQTDDYSGQVRIPVQAGQLIGRIGGQTLDTAVYNIDLTLPGFISPELYDAESWKIHTDDFFSYFDEPLRSELLALNWRTAEPRSGKIDYDQPGKLIGNWFLEGTNGYAGAGSYGSGSGSDGYWVGHLAIFYENINPDRIIVSFGNYQGSPQFFYVLGNAPDPADVDVDSGIIKYQLTEPVRYNQKSALSTVPSTIVQGTVLFQVLAGEKLQMEVFPGKTGDQVSGFTSAALTYER